MLPLHLGFHNGCEGAVVDLILVAYPQSVAQADAPGAAANAVILGSVVSFNQNQFCAPHAPSSAKPSPRQQRQQ